MHNGIIENHEVMRKRLQAEGYEFVSDTDTEVIAHLIAFNLKHTDDLLTAVCTSIDELQGAYAIAVMEEARPERIVVARNGAPLLLGLGESGNYAASDASALLKATRNMIYLEEGDVAELTRDGYRIVNCLQGNSIREVKRTVHESNLSSEAIELGPYTHYMQKEIFEQPSAVANTLKWSSMRNLFRPIYLAARPKSILPNQEYSHSGMRDQLSCRTGCALLAGNRCRSSVQR